MTFTQKRFLSFCIILAVVLGALFGIYSYINSFQKIHVDFTGDHTGLKATLYKVPFENHEVSPDIHIKKENVVEEFDQDSTFKLKKGEYLLVTTSSGDHIAETTQIVLENNKVDTVIEAKPSKEKLKTILAKEKDQIHSVIAATFPGVLISNSISAGELYENGDWYGATITPKMSNEERRQNYIDIYRLIAKKNNGKWEVVTQPPELILSHKKYPQIPRNILSEVNKQPSF